MNVFKSLMKISFFKILRNDFQIKELNQNIQPNLRVSMENFFQDLNFYYQFDWSSMALNGSNILFNYLILLILLLNILRNLVYTFMDSTDQMFRLYLGDLIQFVSDDTSFIAIAFTGISCYGTSIFCLFHYSKLNKLKCSKVFNPINGTIDFVSNKILLRKSAKKLIRCSLIILTLSVVILYLTTITCVLVFIFFSLRKLHFTFNFLLYAMPWVLINTIWVFYCSGYHIISWFISIPCYHYTLRIYQLDYHLGLVLKRKRFQRMNKYINWLLDQYTEIFNEINQLNTFAEKLLFSFFFFLISTMIFLIYNLIYVKLSFVSWFGHQIVVCDILFTSSIIILNAIKITNQLDKNKCNLIKLLYNEKLEIKKKIKVTNSF